MYRYFIRPLFFLIDPEKIHHLLVAGIKFFFKIPGLGVLIGKTHSIHHPDLEREVFGLKFANPVGLAAGFDKNACIFNEFASFGFSFIEIGTITPQPQPGNSLPRLFRLVKDQALINRMGINNQGMEAAVKRLRKRRQGVIVGGSIGKNTITPNDKAADDYVDCFNALYDYVDYIAVNVSCPNVESLTELQEKDILLEILTRLTNLRKERNVHKPVLLKISPDLNFEQINETLDIVRQTGTDGIIATNTTTGRTGLTTDSREVEQIGMGGLSGLPLRDRSTEIIRYISERTGNTLPIIGVGGILTEKDALEKLEAGASLIQLYTGFIYQGPGFAKRIHKAILAKGF